MALGLAALLVITAVIRPAQAFDAIDWNTIMLLGGMMVFVGLLGEAGLFARVGGAARRWAGNRPWRLAIGFYLLAGVISAFLDNVTTILLLSPALIAAAEALDLDPVPLLMIEVVASNLGGMGTLIGDPPNILIGTAANMSFMDFVRTLGPAAVILLALLVIVLPRFIRLTTIPSQDVPRVREVEESYPLAKKLPGLLIILGMMFLGFITQQQLHVEVGMVAVAGMVLGLIYTRPSLGPLVKHVDVGTLGFFVGIFVLVGALESSGLIAMVAHLFGHASLGVWLPLVLMVGAAVFSALLDNVPLVAAMLPILTRLVADHPQYGVELWVALALGAAIGGNGTVIGASANVVVQGLAYDRGYTMDFRRFSRFGLPVAGFSLLLGLAYLVVRF